MALPADSVPIAPLRESGFELARLPPTAVLASRGPGSRRVTEQVFDDPRLELVRLLHGAAEIEHALIVEYLYAAHSVKDEHLEAATAALVPIAIEEMRHLESVNTILVELGQPPNLRRRSFPFEPGTYPFPFELVPLDRRTLARWIRMESPAAPDASQAARASALVPPSGAPGDGAAAAIGSIYLDVELLLARLGKEDGTDVAGWMARARSIREEGEQKHYQALLGLSRDRAFDWDGAGPARPSAPRNPTMYPGAKGTIHDVELRAIARLGNLNYWIAMGMIDAHFRFFQGKGPEAETLRNAAVAHMRDALAPAALESALRGGGLPFDSLAQGYCFGATPAAAFAFLQQLVGECRDAIGPATSVPWLHGSESFGLVLDESSRALGALAEGRTSGTREWL